MMQMIKEITEVIVYVAVMGFMHRDNMILGGQQMRNEARSVGISKRQAEYRARISVTSAIGSEMGISDIRKK